MAAPGRLFISNAKGDEDWLRRVLTAWKPLERDGTFQLWCRETEFDVGSSLDYHAAVILITQNYIADDELQRTELTRFIDYPSRGRGLFWIPIEETLYERTALGFQKIKPVWGFKGADAEISTVDKLTEQEQRRVWVDVAREIGRWWEEASPKLGDQLVDTHVNKQIVIEPTPQVVLRSQLAIKDRTQLLRILPCLIDREPQEKPLSKRAASKMAPGPAAEPAKIVFVLPGPREERPDRFADRLDGYTMAAMRARGALQGNIEFCRAGWPSHAEGEAVRGLFEEYLDAVFMSMRLDLETNSSEIGDDYMNEAAAILKPRMRDTRFVFWTEIAASNWGPTAKELFITVLSWWKHFVPGANRDFLAPIVVLVPAMTTSDSLHICPVFRTKVILRCSTSFCL